MAGRAPLSLPGDEEIDSLEERIRRRAHEIYLRRSDREGSPEQDWLQAEEEIRREQEEQRNSVKDAKPGRS
jgi:hypothetical protein